MNVDKHTYAYQEIGYENGISNKLDAPHKTGTVGNKAIEYQSGIEGAENCLKPYQLRKH